MKKYAVCGISNRAIGMFIRPIMEKFGTSAVLCAVLDPDARRYEVLKQNCPGAEKIPFYQGEEKFGSMLSETRPDVIISAGIDRTHMSYILKALENNLDVLSEKPMVTTAEDAGKILAAEKKSRGKITVTFNVRYNPLSMAVKDIIHEGKIGRITYVDLNWCVDTYHGSSYFMRWNRLRKNSGGLSIHKSTHHFDLINWWINQKPLEVSAFGARNYFGPESEYNPAKKDGRHCGSCAEREQCRYYSRWHSRTDDAAPADDHLNTVNKGRAAGDYTGYSPDMCIYDSEIDIEDTYVANIRYDQGAFLSYSVNFSAPYEGFRVTINGTKGRLETCEYQAPDRLTFTPPEQTIDYFPLFGARQTIRVVKNKGGHGGADPLLQEDLFISPLVRPYEMNAGSLAGALSVAMGEAVWKSSKENKIIRINDLLKF
ncbi:MAG TPA: oxidoreductase [Spirochaetia bacterium]|nr:oxidoreductase [Spirochaetia bacterium]